MESGHKLDMWVELAMAKHRCQWLSTWIYHCFKKWEEPIRWIVHMCKSASLHMEWSVKSNNIWVGWNWLDCYPAWPGAKVFYNENVNNNNCMFNAGVDGTCFVSVVVVRKWLLQYFLVLVGDLLEQFNVILGNQSITSEVDLSDVDATDEVH